MRIRLAESPSRPHGARGSRVSPGHSGGRHAVVSPHTSRRIDAHPRSRHHRAMNKHAKVCPSCNGTGQVDQVVIDRKTGGRTVHKTTCPRCVGTGTL